jgi:glycosyltransferase involved in cell wall biosynthesis
LRKELERLVADSGLTGRVTLPGVTPDPFEKFSRADLFVLSSRYEGWPLVLGEAMACGLPVISFDCKTGPGDIVEHGSTGWLVPPDDVGALAQAMEQLIADPARRRQLARNATAVAERLSPAKIMQRWDELIDSVVKN